MGKLRIAELFAGIGGVTGGFVDAGGFDPVFLTDVDPDAQTTFATNFPSLKRRYVLARVERVTGPMLLEAAGGELDGLLGCPPCQGLSAAGLRDRRDERNQLLFDFCRLTRKTKPKFFVLENVPGLLHARIYREFVETLSSSYVVKGEVLNAAEYGVPQLRRRAIVVGFRRDLGITPSLPAPSHGGSGKVFEYSTGRFVKPYAEGRRLLGLRTRVDFPARELITLKKAIGDLPSSVSHLEDAKHYKSEPFSAYQKRLRGAGVLTNHIGWAHGAEMRLRLKAIKPGDCPHDQGDRHRNRIYFSQAYARLHRHGLARTVTTNFHNPGSGRFAHYSAPRTLTLREALRIQGFPDTFSFDLDAIYPSYAERLIGNAFPRPLARAIAMHVRSLIR